MKSLNWKTAVSFSVLGFFCLSVPLDSYAGCGITLHASNSGTEDIDVVIFASYVRSPWSLKWQKLRDDCLSDTWTIDPGDYNAKRACKLESGCNYKRRYRFLVEKDGDTRWKYVPSETGWKKRGARDVYLRDLKDLF